MNCLACGRNINQGWLCEICSNTSDEIDIGDRVLIPNGEGKPLSGKVISIDSNNVATIRVDDVSFPNDIKCTDLRLL